jgi:hypothetical protein
MTLLIIVVLGFVALRLVVSGLATLVVYPERVFFYLLLGYVVIKAMEH